MVLIQQDEKVAGVVTNQLGPLPCLLIWISMLHPKRTPSPDPSRLTCTPVAANSHKIRVLLTNLRLHIPD